MVGLGSYDPWTTTSQLVGMLSFAALTSVQYLNLSQTLLQSFLQTLSQSKLKKKCMYYVVTWTTISSTNVQTVSISVPTVKSLEDMMR